MKSFQSIRQVGPIYKLAYVALTPYVGPFVDLQVTGLQHLPAQGGAILAFNHLSKFDPLNIGYAFGVNGIEVHFLAKAELFDVPLLGTLLTKWGMVPVSRGADKAADSLSKAQTALNEGQKIGVFFEGTLTRDPAYWPMKGKTGAARMALDSGAPLIPVVQWGTQNVMERYLSRPRLKRTTVHVRILPAIEVADLAADSSDRQAVLEVTRRLENALREGLSDIRGEEAPEKVFDPETGPDRKTLSRFSKWRRQLAAAARKQEILGN